MREPTIRLVPGLHGSSTRLGLRGGHPLLPKTPVGMSRAEWLRCLMESPTGEGLLEGGIVVAGTAELAGAEVPSQRKLGSLRGSVTYIAADFDAPLQDFKGCIE